MHRLPLILLRCLGISDLTSINAHAKTENQLSEYGFYPTWSEQARYKQPIQARDTDSALGRYALKPKTIGLKDMAHILGDQGKPVSAAEMDTFEQLSEQLSRKMLSTPPADLVDVHPLPNYRFVFLDIFGSRGDVVNKDMPL